MAEDSPSTPFASTFQKVVASLPPSSVPLPAQVLSDRQLSVTVQGHLGAAQTRDKSWIVQVPATGATITAMASASGALTSAINVPGDQQTDLTGTNVTLPRTVFPGDALVMFSGWTPSGPLTPAPPGMLDNPPGSVCDEAMAVVFVPYAVYEDLMRPPAIGRASNPLVQFFRLNPISEAMIDTTKLQPIIDLDELYQIPGTPRPGDADRIDPTVWGATRPTLASAARLLGGEANPDGTLACGGRFAGDIYSIDWQVAEKAPWTQHQGYGSYFAGANSTCMLMCLTKEPAKYRRRLALALAQRALDDLGRLVDGCFLPTNGGHSWGRRAPIAMLGHMMGVPQFADPTTIVGERLPEDHGFPFGDWWFGNGPTGMPWTVRFPFHSTGGHAHFHDDPSTWGIPPDESMHGSHAWETVYWSQKYAALTGSAAAVYLMGAEMYAPKMVQAIRQYQERPPASVIAYMATLGWKATGPVVFGQPTWPWERTYAGPLGFASLVWRRYVLGLSTGIPAP